MDLDKEEDGIDYKRLLGDSGFSLHSVNGEMLSIKCHRGHITDTNINEISLKRLKGKHLCTTCKSGCNYSDKILMLIENIFGVPFKIVNPMFDSTRTFQSFRGAIVCVFDKSASFANIHSRGDKLATAEIRREPLVEGAKGVILMKIYHSLSDKNLSKDIISSLLALNCLPESIRERISKKPKDTSTIGSKIADIPKQTININEYKNIEECVYQPPKPSILPVQTQAKLSSDSKTDTKLKAIRKSIDKVPEDFSLDGEMKKLQKLGVYL